jgi:hypothetical protein
MAEPNPPFTQLLRKLLPILLWVSLLLTLLGIGLKYLQLPVADQVLMIGLSTLAGVYFLMAFMPPIIPAGIQPLLFSLIVIKVLYISSSVVTIGVLFRLLHLPGNEEMLFVGMGSLAIACLVASLLFLMKSDNWTVLKEAFIRAITLLLLAVVILRNVS